MENNIMQVGNVTIEVKDGKVFINTKDSEVIVNDEKLFYIYPETLDASLKSFLNQYSTEYNNYFMEFGRNSDVISGKVSYLNREFQVLLPDNPERESVVFDFDFLVNPREFYEAFDLTSYYEDRTDELSKLEDTVNLAWLQVDKVFSAAGLQYDFKYGTDNASESRENYCLYMLSIYVKQNSFNEEGFKTCIEELVKYQNYTKNLLNSMKEVMKRGSL